MQRYEIPIAVHECFPNYFRIGIIFFDSRVRLQRETRFEPWCGHLVIWSFVKIEKGCCQNRHYNINILYLYIVSNDRDSEIDFDQMTLTKMTT